MLEGICFSVGSAYFVTGSYPEGTLSAAAGDSDYWDDFHPPEEQFTAENPFFTTESGVAVVTGGTGGGMDRYSGSNSNIDGNKHPTNSTSTGAKWAKLPDHLIKEEDELNLTLLENDQLHHY